VSRAAPWIHRLALLTAGSTTLLVFAGGMVTSTGSGLSVPDWPLSFGTLFPAMRGGVFYEHGHRLIAGAVAILTFLLALAVWRREARRSVRVLAALAACLVLIQALLGGLTVLLLLPTAVSVAHAGVANLFFLLTVALAVQTRPRPPVSLSQAVSGGATPGWIALTVVIYLQILLGAVMRHSGAGLAIPDFPLAFGSLVPPLTTWPVIIHFAHRLGAVLVLVMAGVLLARTLAAAQSLPALVQPAIVLSGLLPLQILLAAFTIWSRKAPLITSLHVVVGTVILGVAFWGTLRACRLAPARGKAEPAGPGRTAVQGGPA
jgi:cytochrome c oxidase assembly protein subunit 15